MSQDERIDALDEAILGLDVEAVDRLCKEIVQQDLGSDSPLSVKIAKRILTNLRRKRFFGAMQHFAEAYLKSVDLTDTETATIRLQLAQARIDQGKLLEAMSHLRRIAKTFDIQTHAGREARGLRGRIAKQTYVNTAMDRDPAFLDEAVDHYMSVYCEPALRDTCWWHGINVVACLARAERDGILGEIETHGIDWRQEAKTILGTVKGYDRNDPEFTWAAGTALEASIALEDEVNAIRWAQRYIDAPFADEFELGSTERQLREVWQIDVREAPGSNALRLLQGALGTRGGDLELAATPEAVRAFDTVEYQAQLGDEAAQSVRWIENLYARCRSVVWIASRTDDSRSGTGFFVRRDLTILNGRRFPVPPSKGDLWLITNFHVLNTKGERLNDTTPPAIALEDAKIRLTLLDGQPEYSLADLAAEGRATLIAELKEPYDFTLITIDLPDIMARYPKFGIPASEHDDILPRPGRPDPRLYVIGHPHGGVMKVSLYDNNLIKVDPPDLRYRSPTEEGSSGSPVLSRDLNVVAVHQGTIRVPPAKKRGDDEIDDAPQAANTGILLDAIADHLSQKAKDTS